MSVIMEFVFFFGVFNCLYLLDGLGVFVVF